MVNKGMDRDLSLQLLDSITTMSGLVETIDHTLFQAVITTQPTDQTGAIGDTVYFQVVATNVASYQWQYQPVDSPNWRPSTRPGNTTDTLEVEINEERYTHKYRCRIKGKDGSYITTNVVQILPNS